MERTDLAYMAGIVDGEGFIGIDSCCKRKNKPSAYQLRVGVVNTNRELLEWIKENFEGSVSSRGKPTSIKHKQSYQWRVEAKKAGKLLRLIRPYLIIKREQANIGLEFRATYEKMKGVLYTHRNGRFINTIINPKVIPLREQLRERILQLNRRGVNANQETRTAHANRK